MRLVVGAIRRYRITILAFVRHGLRKRRNFVRADQLRINIAQRALWREDAQFGFVHSAVPVPILPAQVVAQSGQPAEVMFRLGCPQRTRVLLMRRSVHPFLVRTAYVIGSRNELCRFEYHLNDVSVIVIARTKEGVGMQNENVHANRNGYSDLDSLVANAVSLLRTVASRFSHNRA